MLFWSIPLGSWDVSTIMAPLSANDKLNHPVTYAVEGSTQGPAARVFIFTPSPVGMVDRPSVDMLEASSNKLITIVMKDQTGGETFVSMARSRVFGVYAKHQAQGGQSCSHLLPP